MNETIQIQLFASLCAYMPENADNYPIHEGMTIRMVLDALGVPMASAKLIFVDGKKGALDQRLIGGERIGVFPPVAGG